MGTLTKSVGDSTGVSSIGGAAEAMNHVVNSGSGGFTVKVTLTTVIASPLLVASASESGRVAIAVG
jgi:hypothetical protein